MGDTSYGGENGLNQAIAMRKDTLKNIQFVREKKILMDYMQEIAMDNNKYCFGIRDTMRALEMGSVKTLIVWEELQVIRNQFGIRNGSIAGRSPVCEGIWRYWWILA